MELFVAKILVGFVVGVLIGLSGVGGGVLLLPVLIFGLRIPAIVAVGSDALFNFFTKVPASLLHLKKGTVRKKVVLALACGSIPGSIAGVKLLMHIRHLYGDGVNNFIKSAVGVLLIVVPLLLLFQKRIEERVAHRPPTMKGFAGMALIGLVAGFLVGMTSVGSGSIIMMLAPALLQLSAQSKRRHRHCSRRHSHRRHWVHALPARQRRSQPGPDIADRLHPRRTTRLTSGNPLTDALVAPPPLRLAADYRRPHVVGVILSK